MLALAIGLTALGIILWLNQSYFAYAWRMECCSSCACVSVVSVRACASASAGTAIGELRTYTHIYGYTFSSSRIRVRPSAPVPVWIGARANRRRALALLPPSSHNHYYHHARCRCHVDVSYVAVNNLVSHSHVSRYGTRYSGCSGHNINICVIRANSAMTNDEINPSSFWRDTNTRTRPFTAQTESPPPPD